MEERKFENVILTKIQPSPVNPRKTFEGKKFDEMVSSVRKVGVIEPILIRPITPADKNSLSIMPYEIVAGERRWRASCLIASENGGPDKHTIPAIIQKMTDDEAFDLMTIENLQREDLTELEEARGFKIYLDKKGKDALPELAERTGIKPNYIRRRLTVLTLPKEVLKAWESGKIKYGHCEQLCRVKDKKLILKLLTDILEDRTWHGRMTVRELKEEIDRCAIPLTEAKFNPEMAGCATCQANTDVQRDLFNEELEEKHCANGNCFKDKQEIWLRENWKTYGKKTGTNGFRFFEDINHDQRYYFETYIGLPGEKCKECQFFVSLVALSGKIDHKQVCVGGKSCYNQIIKAGKIDSSNNKTTGKNEKDAETPRVDWHGAYFREEFYKTRIPEAISALKLIDHRCLKLSLMAIIKSNSGACLKFAQQWVPKYKKCTNCYDIKSDDLWNKIISMTTDEVLLAHRDLASKIIMQTETVEPLDRHAAAILLDIDLAREWRITPDYLDKKTTKEILNSIAKFEIDKDEKALAYLHETLNKKRGRFDTCKKGELISLILESGIDLAGKVPAEILQVDKNKNR